MCTHTATLTTVSQPLKNTYIYDLRMHYARIATISSDDSLRLLDPATFKPLSGGLPQVHEGVTGLGSLGADADAVLVTSGRDAAVRCWDTRTNGVKAAELQNGEIYVSCTCTLNRIALTNLCRKPSAIPLPRYSRPLHLGWHGIEPFAGVCTPMVPTPPGAPAQPSKLQD